LGRATKGAAEALLAKTYAQMVTIPIVLFIVIKKSAADVFTAPTRQPLGRGEQKCGVYFLNYSQMPSPTVFGFEIFDFVASDGYPKRDIASANLIAAFKAAGIAGRYRLRSTGRFPVWLL
jgi:hypothetical protein